MNWKGVQLFDIKFQLDKKMNERKKKLKKVFFCLQRKNKISKFVNTRLLTPVGGLFACDVV